MPVNMVPESLLVTKQSAAKSQLLTAVFLWFHEGDPVSIHTLAVAAHDCYAALGRQARRPSEVSVWLASKSKAFQIQANLAQNFFKHGANNLKATFRHEAIYTEMLMMASARCHDALFGPTPLTGLYQMRFVFEHPNAFLDDAKEAFPKNIEVDQLADSTRHHFFDKLFPVFAAKYPVES
jgi:hypothetical protein